MIAGIESRFPDAIIIGGSAADINFDPEQWRVLSSGLQTLGQPVKLLRVVLLVHENQLSVSSELLLLLRPVELAINVES